LKNTVLAICDGELDYAAHLADYLGRKKGGFSEIRVFTNIASLCRYLEMYKVAVLLISESLFLQEKAKWEDAVNGFANVEKIVLLSEGMMVAEEANSGHSSIYKFQSAENIRRELQELCAIGETPNRRVTDSSASKVLGIFSPCGGSRKTMFSIALADALAKHKKVLYLNLECFPGIDRQFYDGCIEGLSELFYYIREKNIALSEKIQSMVCNIGDADTIPTVNHFRDLIEITEEDIAVLMGELKIGGLYDYILLDLGYFYTNSFEWLSWCDIVFLTGGEDKIGTEKKKTLRHYMQMEGKEELWKRFYDIYVPKIKGLDSELLWEVGSAGDITELAEEIQRQVIGKDKSHK